VPEAPQQALARGDGLDYTDEQIRLMSTSRIKTTQKDILKRFVKRKFPDLVGMNADKPFYINKVLDWKQMGE
jgi:hypothetical protein